MRPIVEQRQETAPRRERHPWLRVIAVWSFALCGCPEELGDSSSSMTVDAQLEVADLDTLAPDSQPPNACGAGTPCDDGLFCTQDDVCQADGSCAGVPRECDDDQECTNDLCDESSAECLHFSVGCQCASDADCDDGNACTSDTCDTASSACSNTPNPGGGCDDKEACTVDDACAADGSCVGVPKSCDDSNSCTVDSCEPASGNCLHDEAACECVADSDCDDTNACTADTCDAATGTCSNVVQANLCDDSNSCTVDSCDAAGSCQHDATACECVADSDCEDADDCTVNTCGPSDGVCVSELAAAGQACDDGDGCTVGEVCSALGVCAGPPLECDDQIACTADSCVGGACVFDPDGCDCLVDGDCDDGLTCTVDSCTTQTCSNEAAVGSKCDDGDACTNSDLCDESSACSGTTVDCDDDLDCTIDSCEPSTGCVNDSSNCTCGAGGPCETATLTATADVWLEGSGNKSSYDFCILGKTSTYAKKRSVLAFDTTSIPSTATVVSASLQVMYYTSTKPSGVTETGIDRPVRVHQLMVPWGETTATSTSPWGTSYVGLDDVDAVSAHLDERLWVHGDYGMKGFDVTAAAASWVAQPASNFGVLLWATNEDTSGHDQRFYSREHSGNPALRPTLIVEYIP